jgi:hypothetical protein
MCNFDRAARRNRTRDYVPAGVITIRITVRLKPDTTGIKASTVGEPRSTVAEVAAPSAERSSTRREVD